MPRSALNLSGEAWVSDFVDEYHIRVLAPDGSVAYDSKEATSTRGAYAVAAPMPGQWTVEVTQVLPVPTLPSILVLNLSRHLTAFAEADVPLLALES